MHRQRIFSILRYGFLFGFFKLFHFQPDEVRKKGPRGVIELTDCWISPSNEDDVTFTVQTSAGETFRFRGIFE